MSKLRGKLNDRGFSLVELLVATVVLAIIVTPLLHTFVTAGATTVRSRRLGDATLAGRNIAETLESVPLSRLFSEPDPGRYFAGATSKELYRAEGGSYLPGADPAVTDRYYLGVRGLEAGGSFFNAMITLDAGVYHSPAGDGLNDMEITDYSNMDAVYSQSRDADDPDKLGWSSFKEKADALHADWSQASARPIRTITLSVTEEEEKIFAELEFRYLYTYRYTVTDETTGEVTSHIGTLRSDPVSYALLPQGYSLLSNNGQLPNIYLIYYPLYEEDGVTNDIIRIENEIAQPFRLFLVKARGDDLSGELQYHAAVEQYVPAGTPPEQYAVVYSNIREDLSNPLNITPLVGVSYRVYRGDFFSRVGVFAGGHGDLVSKSSRDRLYEASVAIYAADDTDFTTPLHTFRSTTLQ